MIFLRFGCMKTLDKIVINEFRNYKPSSYKTEVKRDELDSALVAMDIKLVPKSINESIRSQGIRYRHFIDAFQITETMVRNFKHFCNEKSQIDEIITLIKQKPVLFVIKGAVLVRRYKIDKDNRVYTEQPSFLYPNSPYGKSISVEIRRHFIFKSGATIKKIIKNKYDIDISLADLYKIRNRARKRLTIARQTLL